MTGLDVYYDAARSQTEEQDKRRLHFGTMAVGAFGLAGVLIGVVAFTVDNWASWSLWPFSGALVAVDGRWPVQATSCELEHGRGRTAAGGEGRESRQQ